MTEPKTMMLPRAKLELPADSSTNELPDTSIGRKKSSPRQHQTTISCLILAILTNSDAPWKAHAATQNLMKYLSKLSVNERLRLSGCPQVQHYLHRLVQHEDYGNITMEKLADFFPTKIEDFQKEPLLFSYSYSGAKKQGGHVRAQSMPATKTDNSAADPLFKYSPHSLAATFKGPQLQLKELCRASISVEGEIKKLEKSMGTISRDSSPAKPSLGLQKPRKSHQHQPVNKMEPETARAEKPFLLPVLNVESDDPHFRIAKPRNSLFPQKEPEQFVPLQTSPVTVNGLPLRNAFDVIEAFASGELQTEAQSVYLNYSHSDFSSPYDLSVTLRTKVESEHFVISNFGIIHVYPDGMSDFQTFAEWLREASMFTLMRQIRFFREYQVKHFFWQWHKAVRTAKMHRMLSKITKIGIRFFPIYANALLKLKSLCEELLTISFHHLKPLGGYTVGAMEHSLQGSQTKVRHFLFKYFKYCRRVVCSAIDASRKHASELEAEHHHQHFVPEVPLSVQRKQYEKLERDLEEATYQRDRIDDFVNLAEQVVYSCVLQVAQNAANSWKETFLSSISKQASSGFQIPTPHKQQQQQTIDADLLEGDYFLSSSLAVDASGKVITEPKSSQIEGLFCSFLHDTSELLTSAVCQLDVPEPEKETVVKPPEPDSQSSSTLHQAPPVMPTIDQPSNSAHCEKVSPKRHFHELPPSFAPVKQSKSVLKALRGIPPPPHGSFILSFQNQGELPLPSRAAKTLLSAVDQPDIAKPDSDSKQRFSPLNPSVFAEKLKNDGPYQQALHDLTAVTQRVAQQMDSLCLQYDWLNDVWEFVSIWKSSQREDTMSADEFELALNQLYKWKNQFVALPAELLTPYALVCIFSSSIVETFQSTLDSIQNKIKKAAIQRSKTLCERVLEETRTRGEVLSSKRYDLEGFASYSNYRRESLKFQDKEKKNITFVLRLHSILQRQGIEVPQNHKELGKALSEVWRAFEQKLAEAEGFVAKQTPLKAQGLQESIKSGEEELRALVDHVSQGEFIDPGQTPTRLVKMLSEIQETVSTIHSRLLGLSKWKQEITGVPHDLSNVNRLLGQVYVRQEIWKYRGTFDTYEKKWMNSPFKTLDIETISTKVDSWLDVCKKLEETLGENDPMLQDWRGRLQVLKKGMPLLLELSSGNLKTSHWITIFAALGEDFDPTQQYTLTDFALYNIYDHTSIIFEICHIAMQGEKLKTKINKIQQKLESQKINIVQVPLECYPFALANPSSVRYQGRKSALEVIMDVPAASPGKKGTSFALDFANPKDSSTEYSVRSLHTVGNSEQLLLELENDEIELKLHLVSPHIGGQLHRVNSLLGVVTRLRELIQLLTNCQDQWQYLLTLMKLIESPLLKAIGLVEMQEASAKFQEITKSIRTDPRLLSLMEKRRGQKGFRELQGEALRQACHNILVILDSIMLKVKNILDKTVEEFPRLCYVTERDLLIVACNRGNPVPVIPIITRVFPAIHSIRFNELMPSKQTFGSDEEGFQILFVKDRQEKQLSLCVPLPLEKKPGSEWLNGFEYSVSYSLASALNEVYFTLPSLLKGKEVLTEHQAPALLRWLNKYLNQCVLLSMELHWTLVLHSALTSDEPLEQLKLASVQLSCALESVSEVMLKWNDDRPPSTNLLLQHLILLLRHKSDITQSLIQEDVCSTESFRWQSQIQYSTETESPYVPYSSKPSPVRELMARESGGLTSSTHSTITTSRNFNALSPIAGKRIQDSVSLMASSKSLLTPRYAGESVASLNELNRSIASLGGHKKRGPAVPLKCFVHCQEATLPYGFEFLGSSAHLFLTPQTEKYLISLINAISSHSYPSIKTGTHSTGKDLAVVLGRHFYAVDCCLLSSAKALRHLLFGSLYAGSLLQLDNFHCLPQLMMLQLGEWFEVISSALTSLYSASEELQSQNIKIDPPESTRGSSAPHKGVATPSNFETIPEMSSSSMIWKHSRPQSGAIHTRTTRSNSVLSQQLSRQSHLLDPPRSTGTSRATTRLDWYQLLHEIKPDDSSLAAWCGYGGQIRTHVELDKSTVIKVSPAFGCILVGDCKLQNIPEQLKGMFRPVDVVQPDLTYLCEALLVSHCFSEAQELGYIISRFMKQLKQQLSSSNPSIASTIGPSTLRHIIDHAALVLGTANTTINNPRVGFNIESKCLVTSVLRYFAPRLVIGRGHEDDDDDDGELYGASDNSAQVIGWLKLKELLAGYFPACCDMDYTHLEDTHNVPEQLLEAINTQLQERHLQPLPSLIDKVKQLHLSLSSSKCVVLNGPCGSGKTTCFRILAAAYQHIREVIALNKLSGKALELVMSHQKFQCPTVNTIVINPGAYTLDELFGCYVEASSPTSQSDSLQIWKDGILTAHLRRIISSEEIRTKNLHPDLNSNLQTLANVGAPIQYWLVLDGPMSPVLNELLHHFVTNEGVTLKSGEKLVLPPSCQLIIECPTLEHMTPSFLSTASLVHCSRETLSYNAVINTWLDMAPTRHNLSAISAETLAMMIRQLLPETLEYLEKTNTKHYGAEYMTWSKSQVFGLVETQNFLSFLSAVLERNSPKESETSYTSCLSSSSRGGSVLSRASSAITTSSMISLQTDNSSSDPSDQMSTSSRPHMHIAPIDDDNASDISNLEAEMALSLQVQMAAMLAFAYIWSLGAFVPFSESNSFSELARDLIMQLPYAVPLPEEGSVFDYFLDLKIYHFLPWSERKAEARRRLGTTDGGYIVLPELERFAYITDLYISYGFDVILTGEVGTGKSSFINNILRSRLAISPLPISHLLTPAQLQTTILEKLTQLEKKSGQRLLSSRKSQHRNVFVLDDIQSTLKLSTTAEERDGNFEGSGLVLELIRYMLCHNKLTNFMRTCEQLLNSRFLSVSTPQDYWRLPIRMTRSLCRLPFLPPSDKCLHQIFFRSLSQWLEEFPLQDPGQVANALSAASVAVFRSVSRKLEPSTLHPHYLITMHDLLSVFEGLLLLSPDTKAQKHPQFFLNRRGFQSSTQSGKPTQKKSNTKLKSGRTALPSLTVKKSMLKKKLSNPRLKPGDSVDQSEANSTLRMLLRLWCHENTRVFLDRSTDTKDRMWFLRLLETCIKYCFCGVIFEDSQGGGGGTDRSPFRPAGGHTAAHGRRMRGSRARGGAMPAAGHAVESMNPEELAASGIKVDTLKTLLQQSKEEGEGEGTKTEPQKLVPLDQVTMRGEDLTGLIFAQFPIALARSTPNRKYLGRRSRSPSPVTSPLSSPSVVALLARPVGYTELGDGQVMEVLSRHLRLFEASQAEEDGEEEGVESRTYADSVITLYKEAIEHCARLYRVMNLPGANMLLLGTKGSGRKSLLRLMAFIRKSKVIELDACGGERPNLRKCLRDACMSAAMDSQHTLLVVSSHSKLTFQEWLNVVTIMDDGVYPGLFTSSELLVMSGKLDAGKMKRTAEMAFKAFSRAVKAHLSVVVLWNTDSLTGSLFSAWTFSMDDPLVHETSLRALFQSICQKCSYMDYYQPWSKQAYSEIALQWWQKESSAIPWQEWADTPSQLEAVASLAAHIHITTSEVLIRTYGEAGRHLISPKLFIECLGVTQKVAVQIRKKEQVDVPRLEAALEKLKAIDYIVLELEEQLAMLNPRLTAAEQKVQHKMDLITAAKERYMEASRRCKVAEETIDTETANVKCFSESVEVKEAEITPVYDSALEALSAVKLNDILEIMNYREPPEVLTPLFNTLCMLFDREESWEECKQLLMTKRFLESLRFYDRDHIPKRKIHKLQEMVSKNLRFEGMEVGSKATRSLCMWANALLAYHKVMTDLQPLKARLKSADQTLANAKKTFVAMQKDMFEAKEALESRVKEHKESIKKSRSIESEISDIRLKLEKAQNILKAMSAQRKKWMERLDVISSWTDSVPGHAMLCAAGICYLPSLPPDRHKDAMDNWLGYCSGTVPLGSLVSEHGKLQSAQGYSGQQQQLVRIQKDFNIANYLSEKTERYTWHRQSTFPDDTIMDRYLASRAVCELGGARWPLVFDPYQLFEKHLKALLGEEENSQSQVLVLNCADPDLCEKLKKAAVLGKTVLLSLDVKGTSTIAAQKLSTEHKLFLSKLLRKDTKPLKKDGENRYILLPGQCVLVNPKFQLYLTLCATFKSVIKPDGSIALSPFLNDLDIYDALQFSVVDIELRKKALENSLLDFVLSHERPEHQVAHRSLLADLSIHEEELENQQEMILNFTLNPANSDLLLVEDLISTISENETDEAAAAEQVREAMANLQKSDQQILPYKPFSYWARIVLSNIQKVSGSLQYFSFGVEEFQKILSEVIHEFKGVKVAEHTMSVKAHAIHLQNELLLRVCRKMEMCTFEQHQILVPLLIALEMQLDQDKLTKKEVECLGRNLGQLDAQLDLAGDTNNRGDLLTKPKWITDKAWCNALELQKEIPALRRLSMEISDFSNEWKEYFDMAPAILAPLPGFGDNCTLGQKMLLWKAFKPERFCEVVREFILVTVGGEYVKTKSPSWNDIMFQTSPRKLAFLLQHTASSQASLAVSEVTVAAQHYSSETKYFSLHKQEGFDELLSSLPGMAASNSWAIVENCHMLSNIQDLLTKLAKNLEALDYCDKHFRVFVLMPADYFSKISVSGCTVIAYQNTQTCSASELSRFLLQDLSKLLLAGGWTTSKSPKHPPGIWSSYTPTIAKLKSFISPIFSVAELADLDPQQNSLHALPSLIYEELCLHNESLVSLHTSLELMANCLSNKVSFSTTIGQTILSLADDVVPELWLNFLPRPLSDMSSLMSMLKLLNARMAFYRRTLHSGTLPSKLNPLLFSNPQALILSKGCGVAMECHLSTSSVYMEGKLQLYGQVERQAHTIVLFGLTLCSATWDESEFCLRPLTGTEPSSRTTYCAVISFKPKEESVISHTARPALSTTTTTTTPPASAVTSNTEHQIFECPVLMSNTKVQCSSDPNTMLSSHSPMFHVPLAVAGDSMGIFLLCDSELHDVYV